jgi:formamidopyrimidine-DNA glycosylase
MPELPEVEVLRRSLEGPLLGRRIERVEVGTKALREPLNVRALRRLLVGRRIEELRRRSKYLLVDVEGDATLVIHLGMTGQLTLTPEEAPSAPHEHLRCFLDGGERLRLVDPRRFGLAFALRRSEIEADRHFVHLGIEPLGGELDGATLRQLAHSRRVPVKTFLMDGRRVVGVGNIYASESLWRAGIHPRRSVARIGAKRWERLAEAVREVLEAAIAQGGTTLSDFLDGEGNSGYFQVSLSVYGRTDEPCPRCAATIRRIVQAGRSTFYCPSCQR